MTDLKIGCRYRWVSKDQKNKHTPQEGVFWALRAKWPEALFENDTRPFAFWVPREELEPIPE